VNLLVEKNKNILVMAGVILISLLGAKKANDVHMAKCGQLEIEIKKEEDKASALERIVGINEKIKKLQDRSWDAANFEVVVQRVSELSDAAAIKVHSIMPADKKAEDDYTAIPFSFSGEASYRELAKFLKSLAKEKKLLRLKEITLTPLREDGGNGQDVPLTLSFSGEALYFK
jgi:Tfp pilus assembly protein PilO